MQFHQDKDKITIKIYLGKFVSGNSTLEPLPEKKYVSQKYSSGTPCDIEKVSRETEVRYFCSPSSMHKFSVRNVEEPSTCKYIINIDSLDLCKHPDFAVKETVTNFIYCSESESE